ncbi:MAG: hypothetical protein QOI41_1079 [Myxococcales bacterium]|nr:hypothetical protein [Myxococcales bacterium]
MTGDAEAYAHRAIVEATVAGVIKPRRGLRVVVGAGESAGADLLVMTDEGVVDDAGLADVMKRARGLVGEAGVVALVVGSRVVAELAVVARRASGASGDAYARAIAWTRERAGTFTAMAPAVSPERLARMVEAAAASGLTLVEPETAAIAPALARVRGMKSPRARALLATVALGAAARPLLFVPAGRAPKGGLARLKVERLADGWVAASRPSELADRRGTTAGDLVEAALAILDDAARGGRGPLPFKELLRAARERWSIAARARGERVTASAGDVAELATALHRRAAREDVLLYSLDPADPGWTLTIGPAGSES